jgi:lipid II:glycine glycyltransferase (peptidoglycan interpeptide bridge formation enzyme)
MDLIKNEEELRSAMHHKTRYNINLSEKKGLKLVGDKQDIETFWKLLKQTSEHDNFGTHEKTYYEKMLSVLSDRVATVFVEYNGKPIAGAIILRDGNKSYYLHGAMDRSPEFKPLMAPYFLHWEVMKGGKQWGIVQYDFWGIDAKKYSGVTKFKLGWGGRQVEYPGSFDLPISKFWYYTYKLINKIRK